MPSGRPGACTVRAGTGEMYDWELGALCPEDLRRGAPRAIGAPPTPSSEHSISFVGARAPQCSDSRATSASETGCRLHCSGASLGLWLRLLTSLLAFRFLSPSPPPLNWYLCTFEKLLNNLKENYLFRVKKKRCSKRKPKYPINVRKK